MYARPGTDRVSIPETCAYPPAAVVSMSATAMMAAVAVSLS
jgi:hypothetical protein